MQLVLCFIDIFLTPFFFVVFLFQIGASVTDNAGLGVPVNAGELSGMGGGGDGFGVLDGVGLQSGGVSVPVGAGVGFLLDALLEG